MEIAISTGLIPFCPKPIRIPAIQNMARFCAIARHSRPAEKEIPAGISVAFGPFLSSKLPRKGLATQPVKDANVANSPMFSSPSSSSANAAINTVIPLLVP